MFTYLFLFYLKSFNRIQINDGRITIDNIILGTRKLELDEIISWEEFYHVSLLAKKSILLVSGDGKTVIWNYIDEMQYENLRSLLSTRLREKAKHINS